MRRPNILLIVLDATRADACSCYGTERLTTPNLDRLASEGVLFEQAISAAPWTLPAIASILTGLYPSQTGVYQKRLLSSEFATLGELLSRNAYATFSISDNAWLSTEFGLVRGFNVVHKLWQRFQAKEDITLANLTRESSKSIYVAALRLILRGNVIKNTVNLVHSRLRDRGRETARRTMRAFAGWIHEGREPWFALVHYLGAHLPYESPAEWVDRFAHDRKQAQRLSRADLFRMAYRHIAGSEVLSESDLRTWHDLYLAAVGYQDSNLGGLIDLLKQTGQYDDTCIIVVADHGENLGEHGLLGHQYCLYDTLIRVPLVVRYPAIFSPGERVSHQVQTLDLFKTILDLSETRAPHGESKSFLLNEFARPFTVSEYGTPRQPHSALLARFGLSPGDLSRFERGLIAIRTEFHKLIVGTDGSSELYAWPDDPDEDHNLATHNLSRTHELYRLLEQWSKEHGTHLIGREADDLSVDPRVQARLRALGYID
jgi:arylsulfatase A-like enzyme